MSTITTDDVQYLARLSNLQLKDDEIDGLRGNIERILAYVEQLNELDTEGIEPTYQITGLSNRHREDQLTHEPVGRDELLALAPDVDANQVKVPKVL